MRVPCSLFLALALAVAAGCESNERDTLALMRSPQVRQRELRFQKALADRKAGQEEGAAIARWLLPASLNEVSGLAVSGDGRLFAHGDESGVVAVLDYRSGVLLKEFSVGKPSKSIDFEGITIVKDTLFMIVSNGDLYEFREGASGAHVEYAVHKMGLEKECEFEGVAYDPAIASVLLACKNVKDDSMKDSIVIFRWRLREKTGNGPVLTRLTLPLSTVAAPIESKEMNPSDIAVDPSSGNYILVASQQKALMEITPAGQVVYVRKLPDDHEQAEGLAVTRDSIIIVGDEAVRARATLTLYRKP